MKTVFSNAQCAHVWAQQTQSHGRSTSTFFEGDSIFSYGYHYKTAKIHVVNGKRVALVNSHSYSPTTCQHRSHVTRALSGLMPYFYSSNVDNLKAAAKEAKQNAEACLENGFRRMKVTSKSDFKWASERIIEIYENASKVRALVGLTPISAPKKRLTELKAHYAKRL